jgi:hypothetical protein
LEDDAELMALFSVPSRGTLKSWQPLA